MSSKAHTKYDVIVYVVNHFFNKEELNLIGDTLNNSRQGFGKIARFNIIVNENINYMLKQELPSIVVLGKVSKEHIKKVMGEEKNIHDMSFTFLYLKPPVIVFNQNNWDKKPTGFTGTLKDYREYLINHEFGHAMSLLHKPRSPQHCPLMYQQTLGTTKCLTRTSWPTKEELDQSSIYLQHYLEK